MPSEPPYSIRAAAVGGSGGERTRESSAKKTADARGISQTHKKGSRHRKRVKLLKEVPYSHEEADFARGLTPARPMLKPRGRGVGEVVAGEEDVKMA